MAKGNFNDIPLFDNPPSTLHMAAFKGNLKAVKQFIHDGIDVNSRGPDGERPLCFAVYGNRINMVRFLLDNGADINAANDSQSTPLHGAAWKGFWDVAELLIIRGAEVNAVDKMGKTPLDNAIDQNHPRLIKLIRKHIEISTKTENSGFKKTLPNGVTVELIGVCEHPSEGKQWWRADGSLLKVMPYAKLNNREAYNDLRMFEIVYRLSGPGKAVSKIIRTDEMPGYFGPYDMKRDIEKAAAYSEDCVYAMIPVVDGLDKVDINIACGTEVDWQWHARVTSPVTNSGMNTGQLDLSVSTGEQGYAVANVTHRIYDKEVRVIAKDKSGKLYHPKSLRGKTMNWAGVITAKFDISADDIESVEVQTQEFQTVEFKNVSLQPGHKTDVEIEVKKTDVQVEGTTKAEEAVVGWVVDSSGKGIAGATMGFYRWNIKEKKIEGRQTIKTGKDGSFVIPYIEPGESGSFTNITAPQFDTRDHVDFVHRIDGTYFPDDRTIQLFRLGSIAGTVLDRDGKPLAGAPLSLSTHVQYPRSGSHTTNHLRAITNENGVFRMDVPPGNHLLYYPWTGPTQGEVDDGKWDTWRKPGELYPSAPIKDVLAAQFIKIDNGQAVGDIVIDLSKSTCAVEGRVRDINGQPVAGAKIGLSCVYEGGRWVLPMSADYKEPLTDKDGQYRFENLMPGEWHIYAWHDKVKQRNDPVPVELIPGKTTEQDLYLAGSVEATKEKNKTDVQVEGEGIGLVEAKNHFSTTLPSGVTVELVGVADYPSKGDQSWWQADGTVLAKPPYDGSDNDIMSIAGEDIRKIELAIKLGGNTSGPAWEAPVKRVDGKGLWWGGRRRENGQIVDDIKSIAIVCPSKQEKLDLRLYIAAGPWGNVAVAIKNSVPESFAGVVFSVPQQTANGTTITVSDSHLEYDSRIIAIDLEDKIYTASTRNRSAATTDNIRQTTVNFDLELSKVKEFRFQTRPYECVEFKNVSLQSGYKTDVQVEGAEDWGEAAEGNILAK